MSSSDAIFLAGSDPLEATAGWLAGVQQVGALQDPELKEGQRFFSGRARTVDGTVLIVVGPNIYGEDDPEPEDVSAIDRYSAVVDVRIGGSRDEEAQGKEARAIFDELASTQPEAALVLAHAMSWIVAAYLPGAGVHAFPPTTSLDAEALEAWRPWVVG